jgi:hypothetical protein
VNLGSLVAVEMPQQNPLVKWAGAWKDDPSFEDFLEEIQKFREEEDRRRGFLSSANNRDLSPRAARLVDLDLDFAG